MNTPEIMDKLRLSGSEQTKKILLNHGAKEPLFGVKIEELKKIHKIEKGNNPLAMELFKTGNYDAMYLAGLIADGAKMTPDEITGWASTAYGSAISEYTVPWVATENAAGLDLALSWIESENVMIAVTGWSTISHIISVWPDDKLDLFRLRLLLQRAEKSIHTSPDRVRYAMNGFIISAGCYIAELMDECLETAERVGPVSVIKKGTSCKVPSVKDYILKVNKMGRTGQKRKNVKC
ncbi:MAG: DNA alkylation repair protein [Bacteroidales bacterium]